MGTSDLVSGPHGGASSHDPSANPSGTAMVAQAGASFKHLAYSSSILLWASRAVATGLSLGFAVLALACSGFRVCGIS